ncbi:Zinc finger, C2HC5-type [Dillenia turbinata]|uniref:Zinc finger, C2HC5-type n=1 Tax=Dillenia turbinata TaxID=194707 RepID=A0AAN8Z1G5_9MAGN
MGSSGEWLESALLDLTEKLETGLRLDKDMISGLVSYCEFAPPQDAKEYLDNIVGQEAGKNVIEEYLQRRGYVELPSTTDISTSRLHAYVKPPTDEGSTSANRKPSREPREVPGSSSQEQQGSNENVEFKKGNQGSKKKKGGKVITLAEATKGSIVFQKGKPCSCQARQHRLISNCLSCGKIVCEQEGEGPCSFCGALVLREGSSYAGLDDGVVPLSDAEVAAEAYAKRLLEYDKNSAARTTVIDDQSDYYEFEGNSWLSAQEKELLRKSREEIEEAERARRNRVVVTFDLVGRKVLLTEDEVKELESETNKIPSASDEREVNRIKPNPALKIQPIFMDLGPTRKPAKGKENKTMPNGLCLEISGRVQHDNNELKHFKVDNNLDNGSLGKPGNDGVHVED